MIYAASRPSDNLSTGNVLLIPDDANPLCGEAEEYNPLEEDWSKMISAGDEQDK